MLSATGPETPKTPQGMPPSIALPSTKTSGSRPSAREYPPGPDEIVCVSSMTSKVPVFRVKSRSAAWNPSEGRIMPKLVITGSARRR